MISQSRQRNRSSQEADESSQEFQHMTYTSTQAPRLSSERLGLEHNNTLYQENGAYELAAQNSVWQADLSQLQQGPRSSPIAIIRTPDGDRPVVDDTDDDDSVIDVERDAIKLRQKYGDKVIAATYQGEAKLHSKSMLKAPYLGSLSRSENYLMHLPPMSLSEFHDDPPQEISSYGSLRDSHQRGKFLDGPCSYREPRSGQIRRLDHRVRYRNGLPAVSIGERMQQARKLKEIRKNQQENNNGEGKDGGKSSLSAIMMSASKNTGEDVTSPATQKDSYCEVFMPAVPKFDEDEVHESKSDPPVMLSTSLTAFEVLKSSRQVTGELSRSLLRSRSSLLPAEQPPEAPVDQQFQLLSRSMSDPTPHLHNLNDGNLNTIFQLGHTSQQTPASRGAGTWAPSYSMIDPPEDATSMMVNLGTVNSSSNSSLNYNGASILNGFQYATHDIHHNPDTDAAFDMDME